MSTALSVAQILERLEKRLALHREKAEFHTQQEVHHREEAARHTAEMEKVSRHLEAFKATAMTAADLAQEADPAPPPVKQEEDDRELLGKRIMVSRLVAKVVDRMRDGESFGAAEIAAETNRRYRSLLQRPVDARTVSVTLRRLRQSGRIRLVREGKALQEALYAKAVKTR
jgi:hypothetical protein